MSKSRQSDDASVKVRSFALNFRGGRSILPHSEDWHQLIYAIRGVITVRTAQAAWVVPPHRAVWIPAGLEYAVEMTGPVAMRTIYVRTGLRRRRSGAGLPSHCAVVNVNPLLRELILRATQAGALDQRYPQQRRLIGVLLDELNVLPVVPLQLPMPQDGRAARLAELLIHGQDGSRQSVFRRCGASRRTMERLFRSQTGMSLGQWRRQQRLLHALRRLAAGESVGSVALELGYSSASAFVAMFRRELGSTPGQYFQAG